MRITKDRYNPESTLAHAGELEPGRLCPERSAVTVEPPVV